MKKGFTLIELLAIIIILGMLAVITIPKINKTLKDSKKNTYKASAHALEREAEVFYTNKKINQEQFNGCEYNFTTNNNTCNGFGFNGQKPDEGSLKIASNGNIVFALRFDDYCYKKTNETNEISVSNYTPQTCIIDE